MVTSEPAGEAFLPIKGDAKNPKPPKWLGSCRFKFGIVVFLANIVIYLHRVNLNMVIVCMIEEPEVIAPVVEGEIVPLFTQKSTARNSSNINNDLNCSLTNHPSRRVESDRSGVDLPINNSLQTSSNNSYYEDINTSNRSRFNWDKRQISLILSSYYYGCFFTQIPGGQLAYRFGGKHVVTTFFVCSIFGSFLSPIAAQTHLVLLMVVRIVLGMASGIFTPAIFSLVFKWATTTERASLLSFVISGQPFGIMIAYLSSGFFCALGWSTIFYVHGGLTVIMLFLWIYEIHSSPDDHPRISPEERAYLTSNIDKATLRKAPRTPWRSILTSGALFASILAHFAYNWSFFTFIINVPMFLKEVFGFVIAENGVLSAVPYIFCTISLMFSGKISEAIIDKKLLTVQGTRKLLATISLVGTAICLIGSGHVTYELRYVAVVLVGLSCIFSGLAFGGIFPSFADFAGVFSGTAFGISNALGVIAVISSAMSAGLLTPNGLQTEWQNVFYTSAGINLFSALIFIIFGKATLQRWAMLDNDIKMEVEVETSTVI